MHSACQMLGIKCFACSMYAVCVIRVLLQVRNARKIITKLVLYMYMHVHVYTCTMYIVSSHEHARTEGANTFFLYIVHYMYNTCNVPLSLYRGHPYSH